MSQVSITINKRTYTVACDDGQEGHLHSLAANVDGRIAELVAGMGQIGDQRLLVMASLLLADELEDVKSENLLNIRVLAQPPWKTSDSYIFKFVISLAAAQPTQGGCTSSQLDQGLETECCINFGSLIG